MAWQLKQLKGIKLFLATGVPGNAQRAGGGQGLKKPLRFSCRFHVLEFMSDLSLFLMVAVYAWIYFLIQPTGF